MACNVPIIVAQILKNLSKVFARFSHLVLKDKIKKSIAIVVTRIATPDSASCNGVLMLIASLELG